jgi:DNA-binding MarR family transcriptional regulator
MSVRASTWAWSLEEVMGSEALVLLALADQANDEGLCWPSQEKLAPKARQSVSTLRRSLRSLEKMGLLTTITRSSTRGRRSNLYLLHIGAKPDLSMKSAKAVNLGEGAAQACQMLEDASSAVFVANKATGQFDRLPQSVIGDRLQPVTGDRLLYTEPPDRTTKPNPTLPTAPARSQAANAKVGSGGKTSTQGTEGTRNAPVEGASVPVGEVKPRPGSRVQGGPVKGLKTAEVGLSEQERALVGACLPVWMSALDKRGAHKVAEALKVRVDAGWQPSQIRGLLDGNPPSQIIHMASLVLNRLERNVDIDCAPTRLSVEAKKRASERRKQIISQREQEVPVDAKAQAAANAAKKWVAKNYPALEGMDLALATVCYQKNASGEQLSGFEKNRLAKIGVRLPEA